MTTTKQCCVRLPEELHHKAKLKAYEQGMTLQSWISYLIEKELSKCQLVPRRVRFQKEGILDTCPEAD